MTGSEARMAEREPGYGEAKAKEKHRRLIRLVVGGAVLGGILGATMALLEQGDGNFFAGDVSNLSLPPVAAILLAAAFAAALIGLPIWSLRLVDEHEFRINVDATAIGGVAIMAGWPVWQILALGGWLPSPTGFGLFLIGTATMLGAYAFFTIRS